MWLKTGKNRDKDIYTMKCRPIFFLKNFPSNELYIQFDAVFHALSKYDLETWIKNEEHGQILKISKLQSKSSKIGRYF
jgi:hypothetical protein